MSPSDEELVARVVALGDAAAFEALVHRHQAKVRGYLRHLTRDDARADDLAQDTFLSAWERMSTFDARGRFGAWLMKIAHNAFRMAYRKDARDERLNQSIDADVVTLPRTGRVDSQRILAELPEDVRTAMVLCFVYGLSHREASEVMEVPLGTVKSHITRGRARIQERYDDGRPDDRRASTK